jgi:hypothetical protein
VFDSKKKTEVFSENYRCTSPFAYVAKFTQVSQIFRIDQSRVALHAVIHLPREEHWQYRSGDSILIFPKTVFDDSIVQFIKDLGVEELDN